MMAAPTLTAQQTADLVGALGVVGTDQELANLCHWVEAATRQFVPMLDEGISDNLRRHQAEYAEEMKWVASDPARALGNYPATEGGRFARHWIDLKALDAGVDCETRAGAAAIGDIARDLISAKFKPRADWALRMAEQSLFEMLCKTIRSISTNALDKLPSNEMIAADSSEEADVIASPVIEFAKVFLKIIVHRALERIDAPSHQLQNRLNSILHKSDRRILDGIRGERQFHMQNGGWPEGELRATIFE